MLFYAYSMAGLFCLRLLGSSTRIREQVIAYPENDRFIIPWQLTEHQPADPVGSCDVFPQRSLSPGKVLPAICRRQAQIIHERSDHDWWCNLRVELINIFY